MRTIRFRSGDGTLGEVSLADDDVLERALPPDGVLVRPVDPPEVWCSGVTYERSRDARMGESTVKDVYALVYDAPRPELFLKDAMCRRTVGPGEPIGIRADSHWNVPEPEIGLVLGERGAIVGYTIGNDVSSRDIEGANPLYLSQAKVYAGACALGPAVYTTETPPSVFELTLRVLDEAGDELYSDADVDRSDDPDVRGAGLVARPGQPGARGQRAPHGHRPRPAGRLHAVTRSRRRDPRTRDRDAEEPRRRRLDARLKERS